MFPVDGLSILLFMSQAIVDGVLPEDWERQIIRAFAVFSVSAVIVSDGSRPTSSSRPTSRSSRTSSSARQQPYVPGQINNPEFEAKIERGTGGRFEAKPRANIMDRPREKKPEDFKPPADSVDEEELNKLRGKAFDEFSKDNRLDEKEKAVIKQWNKKMEYVQKVSPPPGDVDKGRLEDLKKEAFKEFQKDKMLDKNELELVRKWDARLQEVEGQKPQGAKLPIPSPFVTALYPVVGPLALAGVAAGEMADKAGEALAGSEIGGKLQGDIKAKFGDLSIEAKAGIAAGLKNPEERPGIIQGFIDGFVDVQIGKDEKEPKKPRPEPAKPSEWDLNPKETPGSEKKPEPDKPSEWDLNPKETPERDKKPEPAPEPEPTPQPQPDSKYKVEKGDNLWNIVKSKLPEGASNAEILEKTKELYERNKDTIGGDWNLIHPGQELDVSSLNPPPPQPQPEPNAPAATPEPKPDEEKEGDEGKKDEDKEKEKKDDGINPFLAVLAPALAIGLYAADKIRDSFEGSNFEASVKGSAKASFGGLSAEAQASYAARLGNPDTRAEAIAEFEASADFNGESIASLKASVASRVSAGINPESPAIQALIEEIERQRRLSP